ncbi:hypothetical protein [Rhizorhapis suberifaciens]|uniref:Uncharacterized protein n=1 Tax=Rhizorhapis suberifaciens TaxID=13656 RepID=A0A840HYE6_9SPHN|nr:hypothetical protein [Rhizorhapis suberifaciens]MBB4642589.1 hypothetical protein [Rhizorhapis suberifaciens]
MTKWIFKTKSKGDVEIEWTYDDEAFVRTTGSPPELIGSMTFMHIEGAGHQDDDHFLVTNMYLDGPNGTGAYLKQGIGREIIRCMSLPVTFHADDGNRQDDGGHLTGDGPAFATKMVKEGLAFWEEGEA